MQKCSVHAWHSFDEAEVNMFHAATLSQEEYLKQAELPLDGLRVDGHFHG